MVPFPVVMGDELRNGSPKMALPQRHDAIQTLAPNREHEPFGESVQLRTSGRQPDHPYPSSLQRRSEFHRVERVPVE
jgi:hypothetical protein